MDCDNEHCVHEVSKHVYTYDGRVQVERLRNGLKMQRRCNSSIGKQSLWDILLLLNIDDLICD